MDDIKLKRISDIVNRIFCEKLDIDNFCMRTFAKVSDDNSHIVITSEYHSNDWPVSSDEEESDIQNKISEYISSEIGGAIQPDGLSFCGLIARVDSKFDFSCVITCNIEKDISVSCVNYDMF